MRLHKVLLIHAGCGLCALLLGGCQASFMVQTEAAYTVIPAGSKLVLHEPVTISANSVKVFIQSGKVKHSNEVNRFYPNCRLEKRSLSHESDMVVQPDTFLITRVTRETGGHTSNTPPIQFAAAYYVSGGMPNAENYATVMSLASEKQPDIFRLTCTHLEDPTNAYHLTLEQIVNTLGKLMTLEVGPGK